MEVGTAEEIGELSMSQDKTHPIHALPITYDHLSPYLSKTSEIVAFEQEGSCAVCAESLRHDEGIYAICHHPGCSAVSHLACLARHLTLTDTRDQQEADVLIPIEGRCPSCGGGATWVDIVKEATLRTRGEKEVARLIKKASVKADKGKKAGRTGKGKEAVAMSQATQVEGTDEDSGLEDFDELDELDDVDEKGKLHEENRVLSSPIARMARARGEEIVIEDSDQDSWADALELD